MCQNNKNSCGIWTIHYEREAIAVIFATEKLIRNLWLQTFNQIYELSIVVQHIRLAFFILVLSSSSSSSSNRYRFHDNLLKTQYAQTSDSDMCYLYLRI